jgi:uncharacterized protein YidB (DUF937 family)
MGLLDELNLGGMLGQIEASAAPALLNALLAKTQFGDLNGLVNQLQQSGLGPQVQSWLGNGANMPVTGLPVDAALKLLSQHLPDVVDQASKNGQLQAKS